MGVRKWRIEESVEAFGAVTEDSKFPLLNVMRLTGDKQKDRDNVQV